MTNKRQRRCDHDWSEWSEPEEYTPVDRRFRKWPKELKQKRHCTKCALGQVKFISGKGS